MGFEHGWFLKLAADPERGNPRFVHASEVGPFAKDDHPLVWARLAGNDVHHRRLAGAVWADHGAHLAFIECEGQRIQRAEPIEADADTVEMEERAGRAHPVTSRGAPLNAGSDSKRARDRHTNSPMMPRGRNKVVRMKR